MIEKPPPYTFLPWLRQGIANNIVDKIDAPRGPNSHLRPSVNVQFHIKANNKNGKPINKTLQLYGPGEILKIARRAIVRTDPLDGITNFEPNYLATIEFYDEDFPWRYTPAASDGHRLHPWITLIVLEEGEFDKGTTVTPLPSIIISDEKIPIVFPNKDELWAWAHVHVNDSLTNSIITKDTDEVLPVLPELEKLLDKDPDRAFSRIICPRRLRPNTPYHAFLVPVFESGRLAGIGTEDLDHLPGLHPTLFAWEKYEKRSNNKPNIFPYYYRWYFRTGVVGDFEYLVRLLKPRPVDSRVGTRPFDVTNPGANLPGIDDRNRPDVDEKDKLGGVLRLGGALQVPYASLDGDAKKEFDKFDNWANTETGAEFQDKLANFINLADEYKYESVPVAHENSGLPFEVVDDDLDDPLITAPLYGQWHALTQRLKKDRKGNKLPNDDNWVHELNLDPRYRIAAGFGTKVIQKNQEEYMDAAWEQIGDVLEANRIIRQAQVGEIVSDKWNKKHLIPLTRNKYLWMTEPVHNRVTSHGKTIKYLVKNSLVPPVVFSPEMRRAVRPGSVVVRRLQGTGSELTPENVIEGINEGELRPSPVKPTPAATTINEVIDTYKPASIPKFIYDLLKRFPWLKYLFLIIAFIIAAIIVFWGIFQGNIPTGGAIGILSAIIGLALIIYNSFLNIEKQVNSVESMREENQTPETVDNLPNLPGFELTPTDSETEFPAGEKDSQEGKNFKEALRNNYELIQASIATAKEPPKEKLDLNLIYKDLVEKLNPYRTIRRKTYFRFAPTRFMPSPDDEIKEAMAYPVYDTPMYKPLVEISADLLLPNINYISQNSITLLETNQKFIEAYLVGLNHEFGRELLWREYPTDQRGSYFRQFWDPKSKYSGQDNSDTSQEELKESLKDIPEIDKWDKKWPIKSKLGEHDNREDRKEAQKNKQETVLVIRGELLKKYPNAVIFAQKARWPLKSNGEINTEAERSLIDVTTEEEADPPEDKIKTPLYEARVEPDIYFFGFDLSIEDAMGKEAKDPDAKEHPGWFFVIQERPGEPRFGADVPGVDQNGRENIVVWNDYSWNDFRPSVNEGEFIRIPGGGDELRIIRINDDKFAPEDVEKKEQHIEDANIGWHADMSSAEMAYILYQPPVMVAVHAAEMLRNLEKNK